MAMAINPEPLRQTKPDYGIDAPGVMRNLFVIGAACVLFAIFGPASIHIEPVNLKLTPMFAWTGGFLIAEGLLFLLYVKVGKFRHRDFMLSLHSWRGDEQVLDVGCGRGLLLAGAAKRIAAVSGSGHATGIDVWSNVDMGGNSAAATEHNLDLEGIAPLCTLVSQPAQEMSFPDATFNVIPDTKRFVRSSVSSNPAAPPSSQTTNAQASMPTSFARPVSPLKRSVAASSPRFPRSP
jgi:arsenite methyltransferase